jgi:hypothetical protein
MLLEPELGQQIRRNDTPIRLSIRTATTSRLLKNLKVWLHPSTSSRMRSSVFNELILMVSLSNHGQHHFSAACWEAPQEILPRLQRALPGFPAEKAH